MQKIKIIMSEIEKLPEQYIDEVFDFVQFLKTKTTQDKIEALIVSESSLKKDWLRQEEDEAWQHL